MIPALPAKRRQDSIRWTVSIEGPDVIFNKRTDMKYTAPFLMAITLFAFTGCSGSGENAVIEASESQQVEIEAGEAAQRDQMAADMAAAGVVQTRGDPVVLTAAAR